MAKFYKLDEKVWINLDTIVSMYYDKEDDATYIFSCDDPSEHFVHSGDITSSILNANNELTMKDKNFANYIMNKFKSVLALMLARLDCISKIVDKRLGKNG